MVESLSEGTNMYAIIFKYGDNHERSSHWRFLEFASKELVAEWILKNEKEGFFNKKEFRVISFKELNAKIQISLEEIGSNPWTLGALEDSFDPH